MLTSRCCTFMTKEEQRAHPLYNTYQGMLYRCNNPSSRNYKNYGGRGIRVSDEWENSFEQFLADMGPRPKGHTLDRLDNDKGYTKYNCRWATRKQQSCNRRVGATTPQYSTERIVIRRLLRTLGHRSEIRVEPKPTVFLDNEPEARFYADDWPTLYELVVAYYNMKIQRQSPSHVR